MLRYQIFTLFDEDIVALWFPFNAVGCSSVLELSSLNFFALIANKPHFMFPLDLKEFHWH